MSDFMTRFRAIAWIVEAMGLSAMVAITLVVLNAAALNVRERRGEIAVLRSLSFGADAILAALAFEAALIALAGGVVGTLGQDTRHLDRVPRARETLMALSTRTGELAESPRVNVLIIVGIRGPGRRSTTCRRSG
jgi:hypothetical protein